MSAIAEDTRQVKEEFEAISTPTQVFIVAMMALTFIVGLLVAKATDFGITVEQVNGQECIEHDERQFCAGPPQAGQPAEG